MKKLNRLTKLTVKRIEKESFDNLACMHSMVVLRAVEKHNRSVITSLSSIHEIVHSVRVKLRGDKSYDTTKLSSLQSELSMAINYRTAVCREISNHENPSAAANFRYMLSVLNDTRMYSTLGMRIPTVYPYNYTKKDALRIAAELMSANRLQNFDTIDFVVQWGWMKSMVGFYCVAVIIFLGGFADRHKDISLALYSGVAFLGLVVLVWLLMFIMRFSVKMHITTQNYHTAYEIFTRDRSKRFDVTLGHADKASLVLLPDHSNSITEHERSILDQFVTEAVDYTNARKPMKVDRSENFFDPNIDDETFVRQTKYILKRVLDANEYESVIDPTLSDVLE